MNTLFWGTAEGWIAVIGLSVGTFLIRFSFIGFLAGLRLSPAFERALQLAVPAIFAAIVVPLVVLANGQFDAAARWPHITAAVVTAVMAAWRGGMLIPLSAGMATLHGLENFLR